MGVHKPLPRGWQLFPHANSPAGQTGCVTLHLEKGQRAKPPMVGRRHCGHQQSGITPALVLPAQKSHFYMHFQSSEYSSPFPFPNIMLDLIISHLSMFFKSGQGAKWTSRSPGIKVFHAVTHPTYGSERHQHIYLINWEVLAWVTPSKTTLILQHQLLPCCLRLSSPSLQHTFQQPHVSCSFGWWKANADFKGPNSAPSPSCGQAETCRGQFPLREHLSNRNRLFLSLFEVQTWEAWKDICIHWDEGTKSHYRACMMQGNSMEVTSAPLPSGSERAWTHKSTFSSTT